MKKMICIIAALMVLGPCAFAQDLNPFQVMKEQWLERHGSAHVDGAYNCNMRGYLVTNYGLLDVISAPLYFVPRSIIQSMGYPVVYSLDKMDILYMPPDPGEIYSSIVLVYYNRANEASEIILLNTSLP